MNPIEELTFSQCRQVISMNQEHAMLTFMAAHAHFKENGSGVWLVTSSIASAMPQAIFAQFPSGYMLYSSTKTAVCDMARVFASCYASQNIRTYSICPACYETKMLTDVLGSGILPGVTTADELAGLNPFFSGKVGDPADIGPLVAACIDGSTLYPSGAGIITDHDVTASLYEMHKRIDHQVDMAAGQPLWDIDITQLKVRCLRPPTTSPTCHPANIKHQTALFLFVSSLRLLVPPSPPTNGDLATCIVPHACCS